MGGVLGRFHVVRGIQEFTARWWLTGAERGQAGEGRATNRRDFLLWAI